MLDKVRMVDVTDKPFSYREATAVGRIKLRRETIDLIRRNAIEKGDPLVLAQVAGINAAKMTSLLLPLCHPLPITNTRIECSIVDDEHVECKATVKTIAQTGVEMEALVAVTTALLNIWDMVKKYEKDDAGLYPETVIEEVRVVSKKKEELRGTIE